MVTFARSTPAASATLLARAFEATSRMSLITDSHQNILHVGNSFSAITGYSPADVLGLNCRLLQGPGTDRAVVAAIGTALRAGDAFEGDILNYRKDGSPFWNGLRITPLLGPAGEITHFVSVQSDITTRRAAQDELRFQALYHAVTELPNRRYLEQHLARDRADLPAGATAIGLINIDEFRLVNNLVGVRGGDELLRELGRRLQNLTRAGDFLASLNGGEFAVVIEGIRSVQTDVDVDDQLETFFAHFHAAVEQPFQVLGKSVTVGIIMGVALCPPGRDNISACLRDATAALHTIKSRGHDRTSWWHLAPLAPAAESAPGMTLVLARAAQAERTALNQRAKTHRQRLFNGGLAMYMQPIIDLRTGGLSRVEALARLVLADGTVIGPDQFLFGMDDADYDELFRRGLDDALASLANWNQQGLSTRLSVNISPSTLYNPDCAAWVDRALREHEIAPDLLSLELLETQTATSTGQVAAIDELMALGIGLALDDLGSGHSTLRRLSELPFNSIKLDRGLFSNLATRPIETLTMLATLVQMGRDLEVNVVVEGLEEAGLTEAAAVLEAPLGQGYFLARPMPASAIPDWVATFRFPLRGDTLTTALGAVAYHWKFLRWGSPHPLPLADCPLSDFIHRQTARAGEATAWHEQQHETFVSLSTDGRQLQEWLVDLVRRQTTAAV